MRPLRAVVGLPARATIIALRGYQLVISPMLGPVCRYAPSCSSYAVEAIGSRGLVVGAGLAAWRVLRCNPWSAGGWDPVPPRPVHPSRRRPAGGRPEHAHHRETTPGRSRADLRRTPGRTP